VAFFAAIKMPLSSESAKIPGIMAQIPGYLRHAEIGKIIT
jgi:hypothetical protein